MSRGTRVFIVALTLPAGSGFFALTSSATTPMTTAFAQEGNDTTTVTATRPGNTTNKTTSAASSDIELSPQPIYQEHVRDVSETLINQTHAQLVVEGNGTLTLPNGTETIKTISTGSGIISIFSTFAGKVILSTEDGSENAAATSYGIARSNKEEGIGKGIAIAIIHTREVNASADYVLEYLVNIHDLPRFHPEFIKNVTILEQQANNITFKQEASFFGNNVSSINRLTKLPSNDTIIIETIDGSGKGSKFSLIWQETSPNDTHITLDGEFIFQSPPGRPLDDVIRMVAEKRLDEDIIHIEQLSSSAQRIYDH